LTNLHSKQKNIYYRRTRRLDVPLIVDLRLLPEHETPSPFDRSWQKVSRSIRDGVIGIPKLFLWYRTGKTAREMTPKEKQEDLVTELDVLFGEDRPWYGFERLDPPVIPEVQNQVESVWVTYRRGVKREFCVLAEVVILFVYKDFRTTKRSATSLRS
jgi:hypothetical protein